MIGLSMNAAEIPGMSDEPFFSWSESGGTLRNTTTSAFSRSKYWAIALRT